MRAAPPSLPELGRVFLKLSLLGFGGPNAHLALMLDEVVERRGWLDRERFLHLMGLTNLLPGPNSSEMAIHVGYTQRGWPGALVTGLAFLLPTFVLVTGLAALYFASGRLPAVDGLFAGLQPVVLALITWAGLKLGRTAVTGAATIALAAVGVAVAVLAPTWIVPAMLSGGLVAWLLARVRHDDGPAGEERGEEGSGPVEGRGVGGSVNEEPDPAPEEGRREDTGPESRRAIVPLLALASSGAVGAGVVGAVFLTHLGVGAVLFGGGYVLVALLEPLAVGRYGWLTAPQLLDGVALTQAVPGPISTLSAFVGYAAAGIPGAVAGTAGVYLPAFAAVLVVAPHLERIRRVAWIRNGLAGVNAVVAGTMVGVAVRLAPPAVPDAVALGIFAAALVLLARFRVQPLWLLLGGLVAGVARLA